MLPYTVFFISFHHSLFFIAIKFSFNFFPMSFKDTQYISVLLVVNFMLLNKYMTSYNKFLR
jgi:hypothetical protein